VEQSVEEREDDEVEPELPAVDQFEDEVPLGLVGSEQVLDVAVADLSRVVELRRFAVVAFPGPTPRATPAGRSPLDWGIH